MFAQCEHLTLVTRDTAVHAYQVSHLAACAPARRQAMGEPLRDARLPPGSCDLGCVVDGLKTVLGIRFGGG
ncbi:hypothetical protein GCM10009741_02460 [Kribbella lupini]|uniref:Uncharacterized protein n=1 Tax=Kribbella lupini TaxID=291602 RepID=A0ABP4KW11_9ACTN